METINSNVATILMEISELPIGAKIQSTLGDYLPVSGAWYTVQSVVRVNDERYELTVKEVPQLRDEYWVGTYFKVAAE